MCSRTTQANTLTRAAAMLCPRFIACFQKKTIKAYANQDHYSTLRFQRADSSSFPHTPNFAPHDLHLHCVVTIVDAGIRRPSVSFGGVRGGCRYGGIDSVLIWLVTTSTAPRPLSRHYACGPRGPSPWWGARARHFERLYRQHPPAASAGDGTLLVFDADVRSMMLSSSLSGRRTQTLALTTATNTTLYGTKHSPIISLSIALFIRNVLEHGRN